MEGFKETTGGAATDGDERVGPDPVQTDTGTELGAQEKVGMDTELGKDRVASEKEGAAGEHMLAADRGVAEAAGIEKVGPDGWRGGKELMEYVEVAGLNPAEGETD